MGLLRLKLHLQVLDLLFVTSVHVSQLMLKLGNHSRLLQLRLHHALLLFDKPMVLDRPRILSKFIRLEVKQLVHQPGLPSAELLSSSRAEETRRRCCGRKADLEGGGGGGEETERGGGAEEKEGEGDSTHLCASVVGR